MIQLTHVDEHGRAKMVDISAKQPSQREAIARGRVHMAAGTLALIQAGGISKGDVLTVAQIAGIMAAKRTSELIPMCHPIAISSVALTLVPDETASTVEIEATVKTLDRTGVEMEALTAVSLAALTVYDMCKAVDRAMVISDVRVVRKTGGKSGTFDRGGKEQ